MATHSSILAWSIPWTEEPGEDPWESLDSQKIKSVNPKGNQPWILIGKTEAEVPVLWPHDAKSWLTGKDPDAGKDGGQEEKGAAEDEIVGWHHWLNGQEFEQTLRANEGQGSLAPLLPSPHVSPLWLVKMPFALWGPLESWSENLVTVRSDSEPGWHSSVSQQMQGARLPISSTFTHPKDSAPPHSFVLLAARSEASPSDSGQNGIPRNRLHARSYRTLPSELCSVDSTGRLIRSTEVPKERGVWNSQGGRKDKLFFPLHSLGLYNNNVSCLRIVYGKKPSG